MGKKREISGTSPHRLYFEKVEEMFAAAEHQIDALMPHAGEQGRLLEEFLRNFLRRILPDRFSLGTGLIFDSAGRYGRQTDIVIYDRFHNSQILSEYSSVLFPIECVYAVIEVKKTLRSQDVAKCLGDISAIRQMSKNKKYLAFDVGSVPSGPTVASTSYMEVTTAPRSFIFSYSTEIGSIAALQKKFESELKANASFVHGVYVAYKRWLISQKPTAGEIALKSRAGADLGYFCRRLLDLINSLPMAAAYLKPYFESET